MCICLLGICCLACLDEVSHEGHCDRQHQPGIELYALWTALTWGLPCRYVGVRQTWFGFWISNLLPSGVIMSDLTFSPYKCHVSIYIPGAARGFHANMNSSPTLCMLPYPWWNFQYTRKSKYFCLPGPIDRQKAVRVPPLGFLLFSFLCPEIFLEPQVYQSLPVPGPWTILFGCITKCN